MSIIKTLTICGVLFSGSIAVSSFSAGQGSQFNLLSGQGQVAGTLVKLSDEKSRSYEVKGFKGKGLELSGDANFALDLDDPINSDGGAISFWVKPEWELPRESSHSFISVSWNDDSKSYMSISMGWWEPLGEDRLYFILSNEEHMHCSTERDLDVGRWSMITAVWKGGENGYCKLFVDNEILDTHYGAVQSNIQAENRVFLGSDLGASDKRKRNAIAVIDELKIYTNPISDKFVFDAYEKEVSEKPDLINKKFEWLNQVIQNTEANRVESKHEKRVIFDESIDWARSQENTDNILARISKAGFNIYVPCVWHGRGAYYKTNYVHVHADIIKRNDDPLEYLINKARELDIEIHPWFTVVRREDDELQNFYEDGVPALAYDIHNEKFREFMVGMIADVVQRYEVQGVNLDYIRSMGVCVSSTCGEDYKKKYNRNLSIDVLLKRVSKDGVTSIRQWNKNSMDMLVKNISEKSREIRDIIISVDAHPLNADLLMQGQDSILWANNGWVDVIYNMDYKERTDIELASKARAKLNNTNKLRFLFALYDLVDGKPVSRDGVLISNYVRLAREVLPNSGVGFYHYPRLSSEQISSLSSSVFLDD